MTHPIDNPREHADHPVMHLAAVLRMWAAAAPAGDRTPYLEVEIRGAGDRVFGRVELSRLQTDELAASLADVDFCTANAAAVAAYLDTWRAAPTVPVAATLRLLDLQQSEEDWIDGYQLVPVLVRIAEPDLDQVTRYLFALLDQLRLARHDHLDRARFREGQKVRVCAPPGKPGFAGVGEVGVVSYVKVSLPRTGRDEVLYYFLVRLDAAGSTVLTLLDEELEPA